MAFKFYVGHQIIGHVKGDVRDLPPRTSPPSKLDSEPFEVHSTG